MGEKLGLQQLVDLVAERNHFSKNDADLFVRSFFALIEKGLEQDKYVKIKGLGSFKLIRIESRESINVNTGERFLIEEHTRISFTPDPVLKDSVNKPFSHFETVVLNAGVEFDDMEIPESTPAEPMDEAIVPEPEITTPAPEPVTTEKEEKPEEKEETLSTTLSPEKKSIATPVPEKKKGNHKPLWFALICVTLFSGVAWFFFADPLEWRDNEPDVVFIPVTDVAAEEKETLPAPPVETEEEESNSEESLTRENTEPVTEKPEQPKEEISVAPAITRYNENARYTIAGTKATHTVKPGERLTVISLHYYGTKRFWPYIAQHNPETINDPNVVPHGTVIKIPELKVIK